MPPPDAAYRGLLFGSFLVLGATGLACTLDRTGATDAAGAPATSAASGAGGTSSTTGASVTASSGVTTTTGASSSGDGGGGGGGFGGGSSSDSGAGASGNGGGGGSSTSSSVTATATVSASSSGSGGSGPVCGNDEIEPPEDCDDGARIPGDRCDADCRFENPDTCPGTAIPLAAGPAITITDATEGADDTTQDTQGEGCPDGFYLGPDLIYAVTPAVSGTLQADLDAGYNSHYLVLRTSCPSTGTDILDCDYDGDDDNDDHVDARVEAAATYFVVVDSYGQTSGTFSLTLSLVLDN